MDRYAYYVVATLVAQGHNNNSKSSSIILS